MTRELLQSSGFARGLKSWLKARPGSAQTIEAALEQLSIDPALPSLRSHKLQGKLAGCWACTVEYDLRIVYEFVDHDGAETILLLAIGTHDEVY